MGSSALRYSGAGVRHGRSPLLKLQSDERLVNMVRRGNQGAFEVLVARYHARLLSFCRHMVGSREDAEDVLQDVLTASYNAMLADDRPINVRPWLYRIARNRCLNHLRRNKAVGVDSMDVHFAEHGATTADKVHEREEFRQLLHDIRDLPETQRTALVLREMDALSYEQIAEAMETTVSSVKSLLVRARVSLTEAAEARLLSCDEVREELAEIAEGMRRKQSASARRHVKNCSRCQIFQGEIRKSSRALAALAPVGPLALLHKLLFAHAATHSAGSAGIAGAAGAGGAGGAGAAGAGAAGAGAAGAAGAAGGAGSAGLVTAGVGAVATKAAAGIAAAALVTAGTVAIDHTTHHQRKGPPASVIVQRSLSTGLQDAIGNTSLGAPVAPGPGLNAAVVAAKVANNTHVNVAQTAITVGSTVSQSSDATKSTTAATPSKTDGTITEAQPTQVPPVTYLQGTPGTNTPGSSTPGTNTPGANVTGGAGLGTPGGSGATSSAPGTSTSTTPTSTTPTGTPTTTTSTPTDTSTILTTGTTATTTTVAATTPPAGTETTTATSTSPTTTSPTGTSTSPTDTTTTGSDDTTTSPTFSTTATPSDTTTAATTATTSGS